MHLITLFFDAQDNARDAARNHEQLQGFFKEYLDAFDKKMRARDRLFAGEHIEIVLKEYRDALKDELAIISSAETDEERITGDLENLERHFAQFRHLKLALDHTLSQERFVYQILENLRVIIEDQAHTVRVLEQKPDDDKLRKALVHLQELEKRNVTELSSKKDLLLIYQDLALGARIEHELHSSEKETAQEIYEHMTNTEYGEKVTINALSNHEITLLTETCFNRIVEEVAELTAKEQLTSHPNMIHEFVNSFLFAQYVRRTIDENGWHNLMNQEFIRIFVYLFRDIYHGRIEEGWA